MKPDILTDKPKYLIVIGASAGGLAALIKLLAFFNEDLPAAIMIVLHVSPVLNADFVPDTLQKETKLKVLKVEENLAIQRGCVYVAVPGAHLLVQENSIKLGHGVVENRWKPSIDVLFRSAAVSYQGGCIGIILSGLLNDGTAGMDAIKRCGGITIVQDPKEAEFPDMPLNVKQYVEVDYSLSLQKIDAQLQIIFDREVIPANVPEVIKAEQDIIAGMLTDSMVVSQIGAPTIFACPDCGGILWEIKNGDLIRYRCHIGHSYSELDLLIGQTKAMNSTLWIALRVMEERTSLLEKMSTQSSNKGFNRTAGEYKNKAEELRGHIAKLKEILLGSSMNDVISNSNN